MSTEVIIAICTTIGGIAALAKSIVDARKARYEKEKAKIESARADEAEKTTNALIDGVEKAKTRYEVDVSHYLEDEIQKAAESYGVDNTLKTLRKAHTIRFDKSTLKEKLEE